MPKLYFDLLPLCWHLLLLVRVVESMDYFYVFFLMPPSNFDECFYFVGGLVQGQGCNEGSFTICGFFGKKDYSRLYISISFFAFNFYARPHFKTSRRLFLFILTSLLNVAKFSIFKKYCRKETVREGAQIQNFEFNDPNAIPLLEEVDESLQDKNLAIYYLLHCFRLCNSIIFIFHEDFWVSVKA